MADPRLWPESLLRLHLVTARDFQAFYRSHPTDDPRLLLTQADNERELDELMAEMTRRGLHA